MKKISALLIALLLVLSLGACSGGGGEDGKDGNKEIVFEEMNVVDNEECTIKITGIDTESFMGYALKVYLENKSTEKNYMFSVVDASVNGVQTEPLFASEVAAGMKANEEIDFDDSVLTNNGGGEITDIQITFRVYDSEDWLADAVATQTVHVYPYGEENATLYVRESKPEDTVLVDNDKIAVIVTGYETDSIWGYTANLYIMNKTDKNLMFSVDNVSVNGYMADPFWANSVSAGMVAFSSISWSDTTFEENGITEVESIVMQLRVHDDDDWLAKDIYNEKVTLNP